jgi:hypothetical protein
MMVKRVTAETEDWLLFSAWVANQRVGFEQDIVVHYRIENRGTRAFWKSLRTPRMTTV